MDVFVYYTVPVAAAPALRVRVDALQRRLADACTASRLMRRVDADVRPDPGGDAGARTVALVDRAGAGPQTWMEVYEGVAAGFDDRLDAALLEADLGTLAGPRHTERFDDLPRRCA